MTHILYTLEVENSYLNLLNGNYSDSFWLPDCFKLSKFYKGEKIILQETKKLGLRTTSGLARRPIKARVDETARRVPRAPKEAISKLTVRGIIAWVAGHNSSPQKLLNTKESRDD